MLKLARLYKYTFGNQLFDSAIPLPTIVSNLAPFGLPCPACSPTFAPCARSLCVFEDVHSLPCSHRFCLECIMGCFKSSKRQECPLCKVSGGC